MFRKYQQGISALWVVLIIVVLIGGGVAAYYVTDGFGRNADQAENRDPQGAAGNGADSADDVREANGEDTIAMLSNALDGKYEVECSAEASKDGNPSKLTLYVHDGESFRMETSTSVGAEYTLAIGDQTYNWQEGSPNGSKIRLVSSPVRSIAESEWKGYVSGAGSEKAHCQQVQVDAALLEVPKDINF